MSNRQQLCICVVVALVAGLVEVWTRSVAAAAVATITGIAAGCFLARYKRQGL